MQLASSTTNLGLAMADSPHHDDAGKTLILSIKEDVINLKQKSEEVLQSIAFRAMIFFQIIAYGSYSILVHLCEENHAIAFSSTAMNFILEFVKLCFSFIGVIYSSTTIKFSPDLPQYVAWFRQSLPYSMPAILYFINNNLAVHMQLYMDPASYQILANFKIFTTAILYRLLIKHKLSRQQWFALSLLFFGGLAYSIGTIKNSSLTSKRSTTSSTQMREMYIHPFGIPMIGIYCTLSGLAGVYNEYILKKHYSESLHLQNLFLYSYGTILNLIPAMGSAIVALHTTRSFNPLRGFSFYTCY
ncbi:unnamed protein product [Adineta ricciae]|uniref:Uncharacterized protein n=1 Tax=Adineta ricciae TaxID=249248 RepID=A0A815HWY3_ADIRI|nr:unnamed protein product [Adineta ricciae]